MRIKIGLLICAVSLLAYPMPVRADGIITGQLWQGKTPDGTHATFANQPAGPSDATWTTNAINYNSNGSLDYTPSSFLNSPTFTNTSGTFNPSGTLDNTYMLFTGFLALNAGDNTFTITHDDGIEIQVDGLYDSGDLYAAPTSPETTTIIVHAPTAGVYPFALAYVESNGPPGVLGSDMPAVAPEPASAIALGLGGLVMAAYGWRRRKTQLATV
jgi:hypothetical protein